MKIDFSDIRFDDYGRIERPTIFIKTMAGETIMPVTNYYNLKTDFKFNDVSEVTFDITDKYEDDGVLYANPSYEEICGMRIIEMEPFGQFILTNPKETDDGLKKEKECTAYSLEYELNYKTGSPYEGGYLFYDPTSVADNTMMNIILEAAPNWSIGKIDSDVAMRTRWFDSTSESLYSLMMNTLQEAYSCIFVFDNQNRKIYVEDALKSVKNVPIFLSHENLVKNIELDELSDDIVTCLRIYGADDLSIASVNPLANDKMYNLDYFIEKGDIPPTVADAWNKWKSDFTIYQSLFSNLYSSYYTKLLNFRSQKSLLDEIDVNIDKYTKVIETITAEASITQTQKEELAKNRTLLEEANTKRDAQKIVVDNLQAAVSEIRPIDENGDVDLEAEGGLMRQVVDMCAFDKYFDDYQLEILNAFFKEDTLQESNFLVNGVAGTPEACRQVETTDGYKLSISKGNLFQQDDAKELTAAEIASLKLDNASRDDFNAINSAVKTYLGHEFYTIKSGDLLMTSANAYLPTGELAKGDAITSNMFILSGSVSNSVISISEDKVNDGYEFMATLTVNSPTYNGSSNYDVATLVVSGVCNTVKYEGDTNDTSTGKLGFNITTAVVTLTCDSTVYEDQQTVQELFDYGKECLDKLAYPSYQFTIESANFIFNEEFAPFKDMLVLGKSINVEFNDNIFRRPILTEMSLDFEDQTSFSMTFSEKFRSNSSEFLLADVIGKSETTTSNLDSSKFSYAAFANSNVRNDVESLINDSLDVSKKSIVNATNQSMVIDGAGIHLRKLADGSTTTFDPCEVRLINNQIVFTDDAWATAGLAIGKITTGDGLNTMGVVADSLIGKVITGNKLTIESSGIDPITHDVNVVQFRVDGNGAFLGNGSMVFESAKDSYGVQHQMWIDPKYGIIAGTGVFDIGSSGVTQTFLNEDGTIKKDETTGFPSTATFLYDINTGDAYFRGKVYAESGYFAGELSANTIIERSSGETKLSDVIAVVDAANNGTFKGDKGDTQYLHIAYANDNIGTGFTTIAGNHPYMGQYTDTNMSASSDPTKYTWIKIQGEAGSAGTGVKEVIDEYCLNNSQITAPSASDAGWTTEIPAYNAATPVMWKRNRIVYDDSTPDYVGNAYLANTMMDAVKNADIAMKTANGKNAVYYSVDKPTGGTYSSGDIWMETDNGNAISIYDGTSWVAKKLGSAAVGELTASNITAGAITTECMAANCVVANAVSAGEISAEIIEGKTLKGCTIKSSDGSNSAVIKGGFMELTNTGQRSHLSIGNSPDDAEGGSVIEGLYGLQIRSSLGGIYMSVNTGGNIGLGCTYGGTNMNIYLSGRTYCSSDLTFSNTSTVIRNSVGNQVLNPMSSSGNVALSTNASGNGDTNIYAGGKIMLQTTCKTSSGATVTSDRNIKKNILPIDDKYVKLFDELKPVSFEYKNGASGRTHLGYIAQDVKSAMDDVGLSDIDFAGWCKDKNDNELEENRATNDDGTYPEYTYALRYEELGILAVAKIKQQDKAIKQLEAEIQELKTQLAK